ncbi:hypothetical protein SAY87_027825 [Trapa incisa]|uniref:Protein FAR1-RELATED SEQUENCE n=1 Tax=Trapa incisa TaxID=236973 RepID=A0AAN7PKP8_9MYRT|nr:hypothetical protein SAY87_027825 [Trapa incisa]
MVDMMSNLASAVREASDSNMESSPPDISSVEETPEESILLRQTSINLVPFIGQRFVSQDAAYEFYCSFAKQCGFSIRRHRTRGKDGVGRGVTRRDFTCHRGGFPQLKPSEDGKLMRNRKSSRCGCQAFMRIVKRADFDVPEWRVTGFNNIHNHELLKTNEMNVVPSSCIISADDKGRICLYAKAGMSVRQMLRLMELEKGIKLGSLPFTEVDVRNLLQSFRNVDRDHDATDLLKMCKEKKDSDPSFRYNFQLDVNNRLEHIAWSYGSSINSYEVFGDAVVFDTTHRLVAYDMILGLWIGVDNHGLNCFFGCVLLRDENVESFAWALKTFLDFMKGKAPETILTDQSMWLKEAIALYMPRTKHAFCIWHIVAKFSDWFSLLLGSQYDKWKADFIRLYNLHCVDDFELGWREMCNAYGLHGNKHILSLYSLRDFWALPYLRSYFFAGMADPSQSESINAYIQRILSVQSVLTNFIEQVAAIIESKEEVGLKQKMQGKIQREELVWAPQYASILVDGTYFIVRHHTEMDVGGGGFKVLWSPHDEFISCSCNKFEFSGILCRHVLRVLSTNNYFHIPERYLPLRWRNDCLSKLNLHNTEEYAGKIQLLQSMVSTLVSESIETDERLGVACDQISMLISQIKEYAPGHKQGTNGISYSNSPSDSLILQEAEDPDGLVHGFTAGHTDHLITLGKMKERKQRDSGVDINQKHHRLCSVPCCGHMGHDASNCPMMQGDDLGFL